MDFFNSLSQIAKNKDNFKKWEADQKDELAKREALYNSRQYSDEEIARAKALGENIIDVVDIMDNHSESVAENVETATQPMVALAPFAALGLSFLAAYKMIFKPNTVKSRQIENEILESQEAKDLSRRIWEDGYNKKGNNYGFSSWEFKNKKQIDKIENPALREEALKIYNEYQKAIKPIKRSGKLGIFGMIAATIASFIGINIYAAKLQVDSSKIARYQARESLKDPKAFVTYTPEQIAKAKEEIAKHPEWLKDKKKEKLKTGLFKSIINLFKDRKAYLNSVKNDTDESKLVSRELTPEEIEQAKRDQEIIQRSIRIINNEAEKYSQNMEVASEVLINGTPFLGAVVGGAIGWILNKFGVIEKIVDKNVEKNGSSETKELYADLKKGKESGRSVYKKWGKFYRSFTDDLHLNENKINTDGMTKEQIKQAKKEAKAKPKDIVKYAKRVTTTVFAHPIGKKWMIGGIGAVVTGIAGALIGLKLQKSASRAGRYTAKRELEKDPRNFIGYTEDDYNDVKDVKNKKTKASKVKEVITFLPTVIKQYFAYEKFRKKEYKENKLLQEQLMKQEVTEEQLRDAKNLQRKLFNTFEKVDDNSQTYSESMEAAIDIAQPFVMYGSILAALSPIFIGSYLMYKGKLSPAKVINKFLGFMSKSSERMKSKWFKKYLENVSKNVSTKVQNTEVTNKPLSGFTTGIDAKNDSITVILSKLFSNLKAQAKNLANMNNDELYSIKHRLWKIILAKDPVLARKFSYIFDEIIRSTDNPQLRADVLTMLLEPAAIKGIPEARYNRAYQALQEIVKTAIEDTKIADYGDRVRKATQELSISLRETIDKAINTEDIRKILNNLEYMPELNGLIKRNEVEDILKEIENFKLVKVDTGSLKRLVGQIKEQSNVQRCDIEGLEQLIKAIENKDYGKIDYKLTRALKDLRHNRGIRTFIEDNELENIIKSVEKLQNQIWQPEQILSHENVVNVINQIQRLKAEIKKVPGLLNDPKVKNLLGNSDGTLQIPIQSKKIYDMLLKKGLIPEGTQTIPVTAIPQLYKNLRTVYTNIKISDLIKGKSPKAALIRIKESVNRMSEEEFLNRMEDMNIASLRMDKKTMLEILPKIEKMIDNIPKEEMQQIMDAILKELTEHPDEFIKFISQGKPTSIFMTPGLKRALATAGISWATFMLVLTYALESWMADIKLKAGRLGVMKAMEGLEDPRYYANIEPVQTPVNTKNNNTVQAVTTENKEIPETAGTSANGNLLDKFKK